jgi:rod shape-determining protein MreD
MIWVLGIPLLALVAVLQSAVLRQIEFAGGNLDLLLLVVLCWSMLRPTEGLVWAAVGGIFADLLSGGPFGATAIIYLLAALAAGQIQGRLWGNHPLIVMGLALVGTGIAHLLGLAILGLTGRPLDVGYTLAYVTLPTAFINVALVLPVFSALRALDRATRPPELRAEVED